MRDVVVWWGCAYRNRFDTMDARTVTVFVTGGVPRSTMRGRPLQASSAAHTRPRPVPGRAGGSPALARISLGMDNPGVVAGIALILIMVFVGFVSAELEVENLATAIIKGVIGALLFLAIGGVGFLLFESCG